MSSSEPARPDARRGRSSGLAALAVVAAVLVGVLGYQSVALSSSSLAAPPASPSSLAPAPPVRGSRTASASSAIPPTDAQAPAPPPGDRPPGDPGDHRGAPGEADGAVPDGATVFDGEIPAVANLDPALLGALRQAATDASGDGVTFWVTSGWRSSAYQEQLLREAVSTYGSEEEATRWVATPATSAHVSGDAIDIGSDAAAWLSWHGAAYGLCPVYDNEPWHYERRPDAVDHGCPATYADPTHDPRMQP